MKYKTAIIGPRDAIAGFALLGVDILPVDTQEEAEETVTTLIKEKQKDERGIDVHTYAIIFVTEDFTVDVSHKDALPAIIPLPSHQGSTGYGLQRLKRIVERAVGSDILQ